jgi:hypothetical protein
MMAEHLLTICDVSRWRELLPASKSVFGSVEYARICQEHTGHAACLFAMASDTGKIAYPFFLRPIHNLPFAEELNHKWTDILSPEYTGPVTQTADLALMQIFRVQFDRLCQEQGVIAEFAHLHPWNWQANCCHVEDISLDREIVYVDLTLSEEQLWSESLTYACRKNLNRTRREGVRVFRAATADHIREFHRIYTSAMDRHKAMSRYYFPLDYFLAFFERMPDHACFVLAEYRDQIVAATLYLHDEVDVYSYLGGADQTFQQIRPTNAVVYHTINWARQQGKRRLILGGGYRPNDGIYRFKASFSPLRARFQVYKHVHLPDEYARVCRAWSAYYGRHELDQNYFPAYRSIAQPETEN